MELDERSLLPNYVIKMRLNSCSLRLHMLSEQPSHPVHLTRQLSVQEGVLCHAFHPSVLLDVVPHLQMVGVGHKVGMSC